MSAYNLAQVCLQLFHHASLNFNLFNLFFFNLKGPTIMTTHTKLAVLLTKHVKKIEEIFKE